MNSSTPKARASLEGVKVLLVDDESDAREILEIVLTRMGAHVATAASAREALGLLSHFAPSVLISDIGMPEEDGYALIRTVRSLGGNLAATPSVALTAFASPADAAKAHAAGFDVHISKPADMDQLALTVACLAERKLA